MRIRLEHLAWAALLCLAGLIAIPLLSIGSFIRPSYAMADLP